MIRNALLMGLGLGMSIMLGGCQAMSDAPPQDTAANCFVSGPPALVEGVCLLPTWIDFGLQSQQGDSEWRQRMLEHVTGEDTRAQLVKAVVLSWGDPSDWKEASALYQANTAEAPSALQPLLKQWHHELEARRDLADNRRHVERLQKQIDDLKQQNAQLSKKLEALTDIEESMNARRQVP